MDMNEMNEMNDMNHNMGTMKKDRGKLPWSEEVWRRIDQAVYDECHRTWVAAKFLPLHGPLSTGTMTVPSDTILTNGNQALNNNTILNIDEGTMTPLKELFAEFTLTPQQVEREEWLGTAVTLATRATNQLCQAEDVCIFQGESAIDGSGEPDLPQHPLFRDGKVRTRSGPANQGLINTPLLPIQQINVDPLQPPEPIRRWGENTFAAVAEAYSRLQSGDGLNQAHYGPYALVLHYVAYTDTYAPLPTTLIMPGDRIKELVPEHFYGTGTIPPTGINPPLCGIFVSLGGNTMDLAVGMDATTEFLQEDTEGRFRFRVYERFALRLKDETARIKLNFINGTTP